MPPAACTQYQAQLRGEGLAIDIRCARYKIRRRDKSSVKSDELAAKDAEAGRRTKPNSPSLVLLTEVALAAHEALDP